MATVPVGVVSYRRAYGLSRSAAIRHCAVFITCTSELLHQIQHTMLKTHFYTKYTGEFTQKCV